MELVFLWINNYNNLNDISFNFSTRFKFTFHSRYRKGNLIYIDKGKEKYLKNFFDKKGYINISVIVGKNGSGKSSVFRHFYIK